MTGGAGYFGSVLAQELLSAGFEVRVFDALYYGGEGVLPLVGNPGFEFQRGDIRNEGRLRKSMSGVDAVVHLAAVVGDPLCKLIPEAARQINQLATRGVLKVAFESGVQRVVYASTCSNYGMSNPDELVNEDAPLAPTSIYSETKVASEQNVIDENGSKMSTTVLRFATLYGISPRMRLDLLLHELITQAAVKRRIELYGPGYWRPFVHVRDASKAVQMAVATETNSVGGQIFNIGNTEENYTKLRLAEMVIERFPGTDLVVSERILDKRNYRVSFEKAGTVLGFKPTRNVGGGIEELASAFEAGVLDLGDRRFSNLFEDSAKIPVF